MVERSTRWSIAPLTNENGVSLCICMISLVFITAYSSGGTIWLEKQWTTAKTTTNNPLRQHVFDYFTQNLSHTNEMYEADPIVGYSINLWKYCVSASGIVPKTESCYPWKDVCKRHQNDLCRQIESMQTISFVSLFLSLMAMYSAYRSITDNSVFFPLWCICCRIIQLTLESALVMISYDLVHASIFVPFDLTISTGVFLCGVHMCICLLSFVSAIYVLRRSHPHEHRRTYILFETSH